MNNDIEKELKELQIQYDKVLKERNELEKENKLLKKDLEVLEIIKNKCVNVNTLIDYIFMVINPLEFYNEMVSEKLKLNQEEFDLLKEWLESE